MMEFLVLWSVCGLGCGVCGWIIGNIVAEDALLVHQSMQSARERGPYRILDPD